MVQSLQRFSQNDSGMIGGDNHIAKKAAMMFLLNLVEMGAYQDFIYEFRRYCGPLFPPTKDDIIQHIISQVPLQDGRYEVEKLMHYYWRIYESFFDNVIFDEENSYKGVNFWSYIKQVAFHRYFRSTRHRFNKKVNV